MRHEIASASWRANICWLVQMWHDPGWNITKCSADWKRAWVLAHRLICSFSISFSGFSAPHPVSPHPQQGFNPTSTAASAVSGNSSSQLSNLNSFLQSQGLVGPDGQAITATGEASVTGVPAAPLPNLNFDSGEWQDWKYVVSTRVNFLERKQIQNILTLG